MTREGLFERRRWQTHSGTYFRALKSTTTLDFQDQACVLSSLY
ncbi:hypothetical protein PPTG_20214 [Phytophthora nicotianae INRA-310]|uniref:Uncharacterized protein n=1 Tax=Phytophthora nicotianae (strain INRA-310) TaxID=761204 RepID=W2PA87_PHYN3|nr:hypothetical protein PPTG_20214 [Phytophthora nicotianae INRA-310]ETM97575.1 hypothetical protein PPTG_20214 [Phytophthora nicotianae INRA-310]